MGNGVGSWSWAQRTGGRLSRRDRAELIRQGAFAQLELVGARHRRARELDPLGLPDPPDSALAREAEERVRDGSSPQLHGHCLRTWAFAALFARRDGVAHDPELLYLACVLHDLGLTPAHDRTDPSAHCFAVEGARAAHALVGAAGAGPDRARVVAEAISLHLNVTVPARLGAEAHLLGKGVALDVIGRGARTQAAGDLAGVAARWPRAGMAEDLLAATALQARVRPASRAALNHRLGFARLVRANPLDGL